MLEAVGVYWIGVLNEKFAALNKIGVLLIGLQKLHERAPDISTAPTKVHPNLLDSSLIRCLLSAVGWHLLAKPVRLSASTTSSFSFCCLQQRKEPTSAYLMRIWKFRTATYWQENRVPSKWCRECWEGPRTYDAVVDGFFPVWGTCSSSHPRMSHIFDFHVHKPQQ